MRWHPRWGWFLLAGAACVGGEKFAGDELLGAFHLTANPVSDNCPFTEVPDGGFTFDGTFSRYRNPGTQAFFTINTVVRDAGFDGQILTSELSATRQFQACNCTATTVDETLRVALLSSSQDNALNHACPTNPLDGGVPGARPDAGIMLPSSMPAGFDAVRACGELLDVVVVPPDAGCTCSGCQLQYQVQGQP